MSGPLIKAGADILGGAAGAVAPLANAAANSATATQGNQSEVKVGNADSYPLALEATKDLAPGKEGANQGIAGAAQIEKDIGVPVGQAIKQEGGLDVQKSANDMKDSAQRVYEESVQKTHDATIAAESALKAAAQNATIEPQAYLEKLGTGQKVLTAIGMALSGIGSGLTGQPNLAVDLYNKNTERAIETQKAKFENMMAASASAQGLLKTAQDRQAISSLAYQSAIMSVMQGNNAAIQGASMQIKSAAAPDIAKQLQFENDLKFQQANDAFSKSYINTMQSSDARQKNLLGAAMIPVAQHLTGDDSFQFGRGGASTGRETSRFSLGGAQAPSEPVDTEAQDISPLGQSLDKSFASDSAEQGSTEKTDKAFKNWKDSSVFDKLTSGQLDSKSFLEKYGGK